MFEAGRIHLDSIISLAHCCLEEMFVVVEINSSDKGLEYSFLAGLETYIIVGTYVERISSRMIALFL